MSGHLRSFVFCYFTFLPINVDVLFLEVLKSTKPFDVKHQMTDIIDENDIAKQRINKIERQKQGLNYCMDATVKAA
jgi:hypothetical protein